MTVRHDSAAGSQRGGRSSLSSGVLAGALRALSRAAENEESRLILWWPVGFAAGIGFYFNLDFEPNWRFAVVAALACGALSILARRISAAGLALSLALFAITAGFGAAAVRSHIVAAPVISERTGPVEVEGTIVEVGARGTARVAVLIAPDRIGNLSPDETPATVRVTAPVSLAEGVGAGDPVRLRAILLPPPGPAMPGGFDFARDAWFDRLGAVGFSVSAIQRQEGPETEPSLAFRIDLAVERLRETIASRIRDDVAGPNGAIAAALLTGKRGAIPDDVLGALRDAGLAHLLAISGLHMALVCGTVFGAVGLALALIPWVALRITVQKWAAGAALLAGLGYYLLAGGSVATERAFIMAVISLGAIMLDRPAITFRNVAIAAAVTLALRPESINQAGFQMSFGAVIALVAFYEQVRAWRQRRGDRERPPPGPVRTVFWVFSGVAATTLVATLATGPIAAHHFNRVAVYGLMANLVAVPTAGFVVMPLGLAAMAAMTIGYEQVPLEFMALAIGWIVDVARTVSAWDGAVRLAPATPASFLVLFAAGGLWLCLWRQPWRLLGLGPIVAAGFLAAHAGGPDLLVTRQARNVALRDADGSLSIARPRAETYTLEQWLRRDGDPRAPGEATPGIFSCDFAACVARAPNGLVVAFVTGRDALFEECWASDIVITQLVVTIPCPAGLVVDLMDLRRRGPHAVTLAEDGTIGAVVDTATLRGERPWNRTGG